MRAQGMPVQMIGVIVLVVLVIVAIAVFFFAGLSEQGGVLSSTSEATTGDLDTKLSSGLACIPPVSAEKCCSKKGWTDTNGDGTGDPCCGDCAFCKEYMTGCD